jgi:hypothetical protein
MRQGSVDGVEGRNPFVEINLKGISMNKAKK